MKRHGILAAGNWILDTTKVIDVWPAQDALANIQEESSANGGGPFNLLVDLAKLGANFPLEGAGLIGRDAAGDHILKICDEHRIGRNQLHRTSDHATSYTDVMTARSTGRRTFFHHRGANAAFGPEHVDLMNSHAKVFYLGYLLLLDRMDHPGTVRGTTAAELLEKAQSLGFITAIDVVSEDSSRFRDVVLPALPYTDYAILNEFEAERTTGHIIREGTHLNLGNLRKAASDLLQQGVRQWVVIHFPEGALALHLSGTQLLQPSLALPDGFIAGSSGAGDAFAAGVLHALHEHLPMSQALIDGVCSAAACLHHPSTSGGITGLDDCRKLSESYPCRSLSETA